MTSERWQECLRMYLKEQDLIKSETGEFFDQINQIKIAHRANQKKESPLFVSVRTILSAVTKRNTTIPYSKLNAKETECVRLYDKAKAELGIPFPSRKKIAEHATTYSESPSFISDETFLLNVRAAQKQNARARRTRILQLTHKCKCKG